MLLGNEWFLLVIVGSALASFGCYQLFYNLPNKVKNQNNTISIISLRVSSWLVLAGVIAIFLGLLHLIGVIPWWSLSA